MLALLFAALLAQGSASPQDAVGIRVEDSGEIALEDARAIADTLGKCVGEETGRATVIDDGMWSKCESEDRCLPEIRSRTRAEDLVIVKVFRGAVKLRLIAERFRANEVAGARAETNIAFERKAWTEELRGLAKQLFPEGRRNTVVQVEPPPVAPAGEAGTLVPVATWVSAGVGVAALIGGVAFGASSRAAREDVATMQFTGMEYDLLSDRASTHGTAANLLFGIAVAGVVSGVLIFALD